MAELSKVEGKGRARCFFITPIGAADSAERRRADFIFNLVVLPACEANDLTPERADLMSASAMIGTNIFRAISEAPVCIADLTGLNPNVLYEIGVRHALAKPIIHIAQNGTKLPFDTAAHLTHFYELETFGSLGNLRSTVSGEIQQMLQPRYDVSNPFTQALGRLEISASADTKDQLFVALEERVRQLERQGVPVTLPIMQRDGPYTPEVMLSELRDILSSYQAGISAPMAATYLKEVLDRSSVADLPSVMTAAVLIGESDFENKAELLDLIRVFSEKWVPGFSLGRGGS